MIMKVNTFAGVHDDRRGVVAQAGTLYNIYDVCYSIS